MVLLSLYLQHYTNIYQMYLLWLILLQFLLKYHPITKMYFVCLLSFLSSTLNIIFYLLSFLLSFLLFLPNLFAMTDSPIPTELPFDHKNVVLLYYYPFFHWLFTSCLYISSPFFFLSSLFSPIHFNIYQMCLLWLILPQFLLNYTGLQKWNTRNVWNKG